MKRAPLLPYTSAQAKISNQIMVMENAVLAYRRQWRMEQINKAYAALRKDKKAWKEELEERSNWEKTSMDGLEDV